MTPKMKTSKSWEERFDKRFDGLSEETRMPTKDWVSGKCNKWEWVNKQKEVKAFIQSLLDSQREEMVEEMKRDIKKPFNKKEFVRLANEVGNILAEEKRTMTGAYDVTTRAGKKRFRDMLRELVE